MELQKKCRCRFFYELLDLNEKLDPSLSYHKAILQTFLNNEGKKVFCMREHHFLLQKKMLAELYKIVIVQMMNYHNVIQFMINPFTLAT